MPRTAPQPIPYQGSKRHQLRHLLRYVPASTATLWDAFAGSGAFTLGIAAQGLGDRYVLTDTLAPLMGIWQAILADPEPLAAAYADHWQRQQRDPRTYYDAVRRAFNAEHQPTDLLYLLARCVKSAVRFNQQGEFNQSADHRRLGARPDAMRSRLLAAHRLLRGHATAEVADYACALAAARPADLVYLDPPYLGTTTGRDRRYHQGLDLPRFLTALHEANERDVSYLVSFDGQTGGRSYGSPLPEHLGLRRVDIPVGRSSQATLLGRDERTVEALYVSPALQRRLPNPG